MACEAMFATRRKLDLCFPRRRHCLRVFSSPRRPLPAAVSSSPARRRGFLRTSRSGDKVEAGYAAPPDRSLLRSPPPLLFASASPAPSCLPLLPRPLAGALATVCIRGERDCKCASPLSSEANCVGLLSLLLESDFARHNDDWRGKNAFALCVGLSLRDLYICILEV
jgi:hypothetical protein